MPLLESPSRNLKSFSRRLTRKLTPKINPDDRHELYKERQLRVLEFSKSPFEAVSDAHEQELFVAERSPTWLDLFYDLSLVATLTVFSSLHDVALPLDVATCKGVDLHFRLHC